MSCFIVERTMAGFSSGTIHGKLGIKAGNTGYFSLQDVRVPQENMLGEEGEGFKIAMFSLENGRYTVASGATGVIRASRDASVAYANTRETCRASDNRRIFNSSNKKSPIWKPIIEMSHLLWLKMRIFEKSRQAVGKSRESGEMAGDRPKRKSRFDGD